MEIFLARQPIFDRDENLVGYELFYRDTAHAERAPIATVGETADRAILQACLDHGLEQVTDGKPAFLHVSRHMLLDRSVRLIDPRRVVLQLSASEQCDGELLSACGELVAEGYGFALNGIPRPSSSERLLRLCNIVKLDMSASRPREIAPLVELLRQHRLRLLGERVPNRTVRDECVALGIELFQGYRFHRPEARATRDLPIDHLQTFRLMKDLQSPTVPDSRIEDGFRRDLALTYKLLRMVNSASAGGSGIYSIGHAIRLLGRNALYRWLSLLLLSSIAERGVDAEIARASLLRGRLCELIALASGIPRAGGPLFIVGVLSLLDVLLGMSMEELATRMELAPDVRRALLTREDFYGATLALVEAYEDGCWDEVIARCGEVGVEPHVLRGLYFVSLEWAREQLGR